MNLVIIFLILLLLMTLVSAVIVLSAVKLGGRARRFEDEFGDGPDGEDDGTKDEAARMKDEEADSERVSR